MGRKLTTEEARERLKQRGSTIEMISEYDGMKAKTKFRCTVCGYEYFTSYASVSNGTGCGRCFGNIKKTMSEIKEKLSEINPNIEIREENYVRSEVKMECFCKKCSTTFYAAWGNLSQSKGCPKCAIQGRSGKNNIHWKGGVSGLHDHLRHKISEWKRDSRIKHRYRCVVTNERFDEIHHLYGFDLIVRETIESLNMPIFENVGKYTEKELKMIERRCLDLHYKYGLGVCLTKKIHDEFHKIYHCGENTPQQFQQFLEMKQQEKNHE